MARRSRGTLNLSNTTSPRLARPVARPTHWSRGVLALMVLVIAAEVLLWAFKRKLPARLLPTPPAWELPPLAFGKPWSVPGLVLALVPVEEGEFLMGKETDRGPVLHTVRLSRPFWIGKYEVTQAEYVTIMGDNPSAFQGLKHPVDRVSWAEAVSFCEKVTIQEQTAGRLPEGYEFRLPTEPEWEYAARAGTTSREHLYPGGNELGDLAWWGANAESRTHDVGGKRPNGWGIHDMAGNVAEWCRDWYKRYYYGKSPLSDPPGPEGGFFRVVRGGAYCSFGPLEFEPGVGFSRVGRQGDSFSRPFYRGGLRCDDRTSAGPTNPPDFHTGFRVVLAPAIGTPSRDDTGTASTSSSRAVVFR